MYFPRNYPGVPPEREVDLSIEVVQGTTPIFEGTLPYGSN